MSTLTTVEVLRETKTLLEQRGWHKGWYFPLATANGDEPSPDCPLCLLGALDVAAGGTPGDCTEASMAAQRVISGVLFARNFFAGVGTWNDAQDRTLAEVYALLDKAIELTEAGDPR